MSTFFQKLRAVTLGAAHDLLDKAIDFNSPSMLRQYVRDLEDALGKMNSEAAAQAGQVRTSKREMSELAQKIATDKATVTQLMASTAASAQTIARSRAASIVQDEKQLAQRQLDIQTQQTVADQLSEVVSKLQQKHDLMVSRVRDLERLDRDSKAKEQAASAITAASAISGGLNATSIDNLEDKMKRRNDMAGAKFDQAMGTMGADDTTDPAEVDQLLASLTPVAK